jgi:transposase
MMGATMNKRSKKAYTPEYKAQVVDLVQQSGGNAAKVARDIDITPQTVAAWVRQAAADSGEGRPQDLSSSDKDELSRLRKENRELRMERDFLKKTAAWFARESK